MNWHDWLVYDETVGPCLRNKVSRGRAKAGDIAGTQREDGYWIICLKQKNYLAHRIVFEMHNGPIPEGQQVDHEDRSPGNNKIGNLRSLVQVKNQRNMKKNIRNSSGVTGVHYVEVSKNGKTFRYWSARWREANRSQHVKHYSIAKYGNKAAKEMAIATREAAILRLNTTGFGYTERHGT